MAKKGFLASLARVQSKKHDPIETEDILNFTEHLSTLLNSGVTLLRALVIATEQTQSTKFQKILTDVTKKVAGGAAFNEAIATYSKYFSTQWVQIVRIGEQSGQLAPLLIKLNETSKKQSAMVSKVKSALIYPAIMAVVAVICIFIMLWKVIPTFTAFFADFGKKLPAITQLVVDMSNFVQKYGLRIVLATGITVYLLRMFLRTKNGSRLGYSLVMATPMAGELIVQSAMEKFSSNLALLLKSGMPLLEAIKSVRDSFADNPIYYDALSDTYRRITMGSDLGTALQGNGLFTTLCIGMVKMGEESGRLAEVLEVVAEYYGKKVMVLVMNLTQLMEPVIVMGMGVIVAGMLGSVYLPMFQMGSG